MLSLANIRARFAAGSGTGEFAEPGAPATALTLAAVLVPIVVRPTGMTILLTQRTAHLRDHAGQVSFPGGRSEPEDATPVATALREAEEWTGRLLKSRTVAETTQLISG